MVRWFVAGIALALVSAVVWTPSKLVLAEDKVDPIEDIMKKLHKKKPLIHKGIEADLEEKEVKWDDVDKLSKEYAKLTTELLTTKPEKGDIKSWAKLTKSYNDAAKDLVAASAKKDKAAAEKSFASLADSCKECHKAHR